MEYRTLGNSGTVVSAQALGTMTFGAEADTATSHLILDTFIEAGGTFIDTADVYSSGSSEEIIGSWLTSRPTEREQVVIATKARFPMDARSMHPSAVSASSRSTSIKCTPGMPSLPSRRPSAF